MDSNVVFGPGYETCFVTFIMGFINVIQVALGFLFIIKLTRRYITENSPKQHKTKLTRSLTLLCNTGTYTDNNE